MQRALSSLWRQKTSQYRAVVRLLTLLCSFSPRIRACPGPDPGSGAGSEDDFTTTKSSYGYSGNAPKQLIEDRRLKSVILRRSSAPGDKTYPVS